MFDAIHYRNVFTKPIIVEMQSPLRQKANQISVKSMQTYILLSTYMAMCASGRTFEIYTRTSAL